MKYQLDYFQIAELRREADYLEADAQANLALAEEKRMAAQQAQDELDVSGLEETHKETSQNYSSDAETGNSNSGWGQATINME